MKLSTTTTVDTCVTPVGATGVRKSTPVGATEVEGGPRYVAPPRAHLYVLDKEEALRQPAAVDISIPQHEAGCARRRST